MSSPDSPAPPIIRRLQWSIAACLIALIALGLTWEWFLAPLRPGGSWLALKVLPLIWPLAGVLKNRLYTYRWLSLLVWLYFMEACVRAYSDRAPSSYYALVEAVLCVMLFVLCALYVRLRLKVKPLASISDSPK